MDTIFVITLTTGKYENKSESILCAFSSESKAQVYQNFLLQAIEFSVDCWNQCKDDTFGLELTISNGSYKPVVYWKNHPDRPLIITKLQECQNLAHLIKKRQISENLAPKNKEKIKKLEKKLNSFKREFELEDQRILNSRYEFDQNIDKLRNQKYQKLVTESNQSDDIKNHCLKHCYSNFYFNRKQYELNIKKVKFVG